MPPESDKRFAKISNGMRIIGRTAYWIVAVALVAAVLVSLGYTAAQALLIALMFFPCALALELLLPKAETPLHRGYAFGALLIMEILFMLLIHHWLDLPDSQGFRFMLDIHPVMTNPVFLGAALSLLALGDYYWGRWLERRLADKPRPVTFLSDRHSVTLDAHDIAFIESNDTEVRIFTRDGRSYRNKTAISQWEALLGPSFLRIHRSYLVNRAIIASVSDTSVTLSTDIGPAAGTPDTPLPPELPVSRKYRTSVISFGNQSFSAH